MINNKSCSPTISIVTICRNSAATIEKTIESILAQKDAGVEYVIIDGASTDTTQDIIKSYGRKLDTYLSEPDEGIADAFNKGIALATGDIIGLINSDDTLAPGALDTVRRFCKDHPDTDVLHGDILLLNGTHIIKRIKPASRWWYPWRLSLIFNHPATFVRQTVYRKHGLFDSSYSIAMDAEIFLRWVKCGVKTSYIPEILAHMQAGGVSGRRGIETCRQQREALLHHGFSLPLAHLQYWGKVTLWVMLEVVSWLRRKLAK
ncbi:MAG: glycosyltransferase family 2 protein [Deltaproteobacteria bacterium]|nr:glycosyltransferase family 2 protein [Deltaproteobacteria bacterium]